MLSKLIVIFLILTTLPVFIYAQSVGKIAGVATDKETGEPLPGVNVFIEGTTMGSATDIDGYYVILNAPVGVYTLRSSYIGYRDVVIENIRVSANITTEINFEMEPTTLELDEAVVVIAERPLVEKHVTQSVSLVTSEDLQNIPVRGFDNVIALQNSVILQDGNIHIRGGREEEVGYYLDGASAINPISNTQAVYIIQDAVEEYQVLAGGYTAEFGGANSGIIRSELKTGTPDYHFMVDFQTDKLADEGEKFLGTHSFRHHVLTATASGPIPFLGKNVRFFLAAENNDQGDRLRRFVEAPDEPFTRVDQNILNPDNVDEDGNFIGGDTVTFTWPDGFSRLNSMERWAINGTLLFDRILNQNFNFRLSGAYTNQETFVNRRPLTNILNEREGFIENNTLFLSGKFTHIVNPTTFYDLTISYLGNDSERKDEWFEGDWQKWFRGDLIKEQFGIDFTYQDTTHTIPWSNPHPYQFNGIPFARNGHTPMFGAANPNPDNRDVTTLYRLEKQNYISGALNIVSQMGRHHEVKFGGDIRRYTARKFEIEPWVMRLTEEGTPTDPRSIDANRWASQGEYQGFGYDIYGNEIDDDMIVRSNVAGDPGVPVDGAKHPTFSAVYIHDKIEYNDVIINAGLRLDIFDTDDVRLKDPTNPDIDNETGLIAESAFEEAPTFEQVSPRLGVAFPITNRTKFYAQYGKFIQMPELRNIFFGNYGLSDQITSGGNFFVNTIGFGLDPIRTTSYELGFSQQVGEVAAFDLTGFYRNDKGQITIIREEAASDAEIATYARLANGDFVTTKGLEFRLRLRRFNRLQANLNYTLTQAEGSGSGELSFRGAIDQATPTPTLTNPLDFSQTHKGSVILDYRFGRNDGGPILQRLGANVLLSFNSGHPYTFIQLNQLGQAEAYDAGVDYMLDSRTREAAEPINSSRTPWVFTVDLRLDKTFSLMEGLDATIYARVLNLFDTRNVINVYQLTGNADDDGVISDQRFNESLIATNGGQDYVDLYEAINIRNGQSYFSQLTNTAFTNTVQRTADLWGNPRQIFLGLMVNF